MGNMVVVAVRHSATESREKTDFENLKVMVHDIETVCPKFFDGRHAKKTRAKYTGDAIISSYYHSSDQVMLLANSHFLTYIPSFPDTPFLLSSPENKILSKLVRDCKESMAFHDKSLINTRKLPKKQLNPVNEGEGIALFGILTDRFHQINDKEDFRVLLRSMPDLHWLDDHDAKRVTEHSHLNSRLKGTPFIPLGNIRGSQQALIQMSGNVFNMRIIQNYGVDYDYLNHEIEACRDNGDNRRYMKINYLPSIIKSFGYKVELEPESSLSPRL